MKKPHIIAKLHDLNKNQVQLKYLYGNFLFLWEFSKHFGQQGGGGKVLVHFYDFTKCFLKKPLISSLFEKRLFFETTLSLTSFN